MRKRNKGVSIFFKLIKGNLGGKKILKEYNYIKLVNKLGRGSVFDVVMLIFCFLVYFSSFCILISKLRIRWLK